MIRRGSVQAVKDIGAGRVSSLSQRLSNEVAVVILGLSDGGAAVRKSIWVKCIPEHRPPSGHLVAVSHWQDDVRHAVEQLVEIMTGLIGSPRVGGMLGRSVDDGCSPLRLDKGARKKLQEILRHAEFQMRSLATQCRVRTYRGR